MDYIVKNVFKSKVRKGVDAKLLQYDANAINICSKVIDFTNILESSNGFEKNTKDIKNIKSHCVMINLEKDRIRYKNTVEELKKISFNDFIHLKGTYWKDKEVMENDLTFIIEFIKQLNPEIESKQIKINEFSEINDENIHIQDGPLGCFCSHLRAMIHGYLNFEDYTIVIEDDITITNTGLIENYLALIPKDWDIITLNAVGKNIPYEGPYYKFTDVFHSTHFYIINHKCMEQLLKHMYPINDQVDVLVSELIHELNIYNIPDTVYQKCIETNTQNNLHTIFTAQYYDVLREQIATIKKSCMFFANLILPDNENRNEIIISNILYDIIFDYIVSTQLVIVNDSKNRDDTDYGIGYYEYKEYNELFESVAYFIQCSKKAINIGDTVTYLINGIFGILKKFILHGEIIKAYNYGSTSQTYILNKPDKDVIIKAYNDKLRWTTKDHDNSDDIFRKELNMLKKNISCMPKLLDYDEKSKMIIMTYEGESLYNNFSLPDNWEKQIRGIFTMLTSNNILYPEFKIQNILVLNGKITFVDYGLASCPLDCKIDNTENCEKFIRLLSILNDKFSVVKDRETRYRLYNTFIKNLKITNLA